MTDSLLAPIFLAYMLWDHRERLGQLTRDVLMDWECRQLERKLAVSWHVDCSPEIAFKLLRRNT